MSNPLMDMMGNAKGRLPMGGGNLMTNKYQQIRQFARLVGNRNPEQMVRTLVQQQGIPEDVLQSAMQEAKQIAQEMRMM